MSRMLQALRQIEAKTERWPQPAVSAAAAHAVALQSAPTTNVVEAAQEAFDRVEAALAAENPGPPDSLAALQIEPLPVPRRWPSPAPTSAADPYAALADSIVAQWAAPGGDVAVRPEAASAVLLFTSPGDGEGKSTTLARLAPELQRRVSGEVLVVDGSLRAAAPRRMSQHPPDRSSDRGVGRPSQALPVRAGGRPVAAVFRNGAADGLLRRDVSVVQLGATTRRGLTEAVAVIQRNQGRLAGCIVVD